MKAIFCRVNGGSPNSLPATLHLNLLIYNLSKLSRYR